MLDFKTDNLLFNNEVNKNLENILKSKIFSNGYIFFGPEGLGKKSTAIRFIEDIFKQYSSNSNSENKIIDNNHPDFLLIEPTLLIKGKMIKRSEAESIKNNKETIRIDQVRNIKNFLGQKSIESGKKIILIVDAHLLNEAASNCLLKTLEEPTNGLFILLTPKLNLLLDTIVSRCQLVRFKSSSYKELEIFIQNNLDCSIPDLFGKLKLQDLINLGNGSPGEIIKNINVWKEIPNQIKAKINFPLSNNLEILETSKLICEELEINQQIFLANILQNLWWRKTKNKNIIDKLESLKSFLKSFVQPRLAWEVTLLKISIEDL